MIEAMKRLNRWLKKEHIDTDKVTIVIETKDNRTAYAVRHVLAELKNDIAMVSAPEIFIGEGQIHGLKFTVRSIEPGRVHAYLHDPLTEIYEMGPKPWPKTRA